MGADAHEREIWRTRLRWRLRGAWQWPAFALCTLADAVIITVLPFAGDGGGGLFPAFLLAGFFNLAVVAVLAPACGVLVRRRRPWLPREIAKDYAGTALLCALTLGLLAGGLAHRPAVLAADRDFAAQSQAVRRFVAAQAPVEHQVHIDRADTVKQGPTLYRTCVPGYDPRRALCLLVSTDQKPPGITLDPDSRPNAVVSGPLNPGRSSR